MNSSGETFAVTDDYQAKVLAFMLQNSEFCDIAGTHLEPEFFNNKALQWFYTTLVESKHQLTSVTLQEELISATKGRSISAEEVPKFVTIYDIVKERVIPIEEDYIKDKMDTFIRTQSVKRAIGDTVDLAKQEKWDDIVGIMQDAVSSGVRLGDTGYDYLGAVESRIHDRAGRRVRAKISTGIPDLDALTYGGIKPGQVGMIVGGTGRGKSVFLQWLARTALLMGKKVVYFTFELSAEDIADRMDSMFAAVKPQELNDYQAEVLHEINRLGSTFGKSLIIQHYPADTATINTLKDFCRRLSQAGIVPDLILVDYMDLMLTHRTYGDAHQETDAIAKALVGFSSEFDVAVYTATQLNRGGMVSDTPDEAGMAGYIGKQYHADMVIWMAQTKEEKEDELMRLWMSKNRNGKIGTVSLETNYSYMTFYRESKPEDEDEKEDKEEVVEVSPPVSSKPGKKSLAEALLEQVNMTKEEEEE